MERDPTYSPRKLEKRASYNSTKEKRAGGERSYLMIILSRFSRPFYQSNYISSFIRFISLYWIEFGLLLALYKIRLDDFKRILALGDYFCCYMSSLPLRFTEWKKRFISFGVVSNVASETRSSDREVLMERVKRFISFQNYIMEIQVFSEVSFISI